VRKRHNARKARVGDDFLSPGVLAIIAFFALDVALIEFRMLSMLKKAVAVSRQLLFYT